LAILAVIARLRQNLRPEHDPEKWEPVFRMVLSRFRLHRRAGEIKPI
jgi:hypothetical protein